MRLDERQRGELGKLRALARPLAARPQLEGTARRRPAPRGPRRDGGGGAEHDHGDQEGGGPEDERAGGDAMVIAPDRGDQDERDGGAERGPGLETQHVSEIGDGTKAGAEHAHDRHQTGRGREARGRSPRCRGREQREQRRRQHGQHEQRSLDAARRHPRHHRDHEHGACPGGDGAHAAHVGEPDPFDGGRGRSTAAVTAAAVPGATTAAYHQRRLRPPTRSAPAPRGSVASAPAPARRRSTTTIPIRRPAVVGTRRIILGEWRTRSSGRWW